MINMGGPKFLSEVENYLSRIFTDKDIMKLPFQKYFGAFLAKIRAPKVKKHYQIIGGKSPIYKWSNIQGEGMIYNFLQNKDKLLNCKDLNFSDIKHYIGFRYADPLTENAIIDMAKDGIDRVIVFSQYPQYCCSTTGSSLNAIYKFCNANKNLVENIKWSVIDRWHSHPGLIKAFSENIKSELNKFSIDKRKEVVILFSAHSLPLSVVKRGDLYPYEVSATVNLVMNELKWCNPYRLVWQSKVGPVEWLSPFTDDVIRSLVKRGHKNILLVPIAFTSDHIETLHEMDIEYIKDISEELKSYQNINIKRAPSLNDNLTFIKHVGHIPAQSERT
ncbi:ferrochelatase, mitochondrial-like isoform X2 [Gordionus sp. m RMFG-2023]|uniref:ferrochelatase, mitochondrial-like isoform X2 n=1 Tax=Gordionus sp. m RMFG-2023 TaxID=3053472 RepID=UPI0031FD9BAA